MPEPNLNLPVEYRTQGVSIGDVGLIASPGEFDFLFNINYPADDPINSEHPTDFQPLQPPLQARDISMSRAFEAGRFLASESVKRVQTGMSDG